MEYIMHERVTTATYSEARPGRVLYVAVVTSAFTPDCLARGALTGFVSYL